MSISHHVWRAADAQVDYADRSYGTNLTCGILTQNRIYGPNNSDWSYYRNNTSRYGMSWLAGHIEDWASECGPDVVRMYTDSSHWLSLNSYSDSAGISFQLLGQDYLDGKYDGDISNQERVNILNITFLYYGIQFFNYQGVTTSSIINQNPNSVNQTENQWSQFQKETIVEYVENFTWGDLAQALELYVTYSTTPGSEFFNIVVNNGGGSTDDSNQSTPYEKIARFYPKLSFGWFRVAELDNTVKGARANDSGWCYWGSEIATTTTIVPYSQSMADIDFYYRNFTNLQAQVDNKYQLPYGYDSSADYKVNDVPFTEFAEYSDTHYLFTTPGGHAALVTSSPVSAYGVRKYRAAPSWAKNAPLYTPMGYKFGKIPPSYILGSRSNAVLPSLSDQALFPKAIRKIDGVDYFFGSPHLAWRIN